MAQVKKFQNPAGPVTTETAASTPAGTAPAEKPKKKYGRWIRDGIAYEMDDASMQSLWEYINSSDSGDTKMFAADYWQKLQNGEDVDINTMLNTSNVAPTTVNERQKKRIDDDRPKERLWDSFANTKRHKYNKTTHYLGQWDPKKPSETSKVSNDVSAKEFLTKSSGKLVYRTNNDGTYSFVPLASGNSKEYFNKVRGYLKGETADKYDISKWTDFSVIQNWYKNLPNQNEWMDALENVMTTTGRFTPEQLDYLSAIGLTPSDLKNDVVEQAKVDREEATTLRKAQDEAWKLINPNGFWSEQDRKSLFTYDPSKNTYAFNVDLSKLPNLPTSRGYLFDKDFVNRYAGRGLEGLEGKAVLDGKWYKASDLLDPNSDLYQILNSADYNYFNLNKQGKYNEANKIMMSTWDGSHNYVPNISDDTANYYGNFYTGGNYLYDPTNYNDGTTNYGTPDGFSWDLSPDDILLRTINLDSENFKDNGTFVRKPEWVVLTKHGDNKHYTDVEYTGYYDGSTPKEKQKITPYMRVSSDPNNPYYNYIHGSYSNSNVGSIASNSDNKENNNVKYYYNPNADTYYMVLPQELGGDGQTAFSKAPWSVRALLGSAKFLEKLSANRKAHQNFIKFIQGKGDFSSEELSQFIPEALYSYFGNDDIDEIINYFKTATKIAGPVQSNKKGGVLKAQGGAYVGAGYNTPSNQELVQKANEINTAVANPYDSRVIRKDGERVEYDWSSLTGADKAELIALGLDGAGFAAGYVPVYGDAINAVAGTIANLTNLGVDLHRAKNGQMTKGQAWGNFGMGVGADVASIVPIVGDSANAAKWVQRAGEFFKKNKPMVDAITTSWASLGLLASVDSLGKLVRGEDLTMDDVKQISYGIMSAMGLAGKGRRAIEDSRLAAKVTAEPKAVSRTTKYTKTDGTEGELKLSDAEIRSLTSKKGETEIRDALKNMLIHTHKVPAGEVKRILDDPAAWKELGLVKNTKFFAKNNTVSQTKQEKPNGWGYYIRHPFERHDVLSSSTPAELTGAVKKSSRAAYRYIDNIENIPDGASASAPGYIRGANEYLPRGYDRHLSSVNGRVYSPDATTAIRNERIRQENERIRRENERQQLEEQARQQKEERLRLKREQKEERLRLKQEEKERAAENKAIRQAERQAAADERSKMRKEAFDEFKTNALMKAKSLFERSGRSASPKEPSKKSSIPNLEEVSKTIAQRTQRTSFLNAMRQTLNDEGMAQLIADNPSRVRQWFDDEVALQIEKGNLDDKSAMKLSQKAKKLAEKYSFKQGGKVLKGKDGFGQALTDFWTGFKTVTKPFTTHEAMQGYLSGARYLSGNASTDRNTNRSLNAAENSARAAMLKKHTEIYSPQIINAGNAERVLASQLTKNLPAMTSDSTLNAQMHKTNLDEASSHLANATQLDAKQNVENQLRNVGEKRNYEYLDHEIGSQNGKTIGALGTVKSEILNAADTTKTQSLNQFLFQHQTELDQAKNEATAYQQSIAEQNARLAAYKAFEDDLNKKLNGATFDITNPEHKAIYDTLSKQYMYYGLGEDVSKALFSTLSPSAQRYANRYFVASKKTGGKVRSASEQIAINSNKAEDQIKVNAKKAVDQIRVNRYKEFDKAWTESNKAIQRAIAKMNDRVHDLLMKMLS